MLNDYYTRILPRPVPGGNPFPALTHTPGRTASQTAAPCWQTDPRLPPPRGAGSASPEDFQRISEQYSQEVPVPAPDLKTRRRQLEAQRAAVLHGAKHRRSCGATVADVLQSLLSSGVDAGFFFAANAVALTAFARSGRGALTGWEPRTPNEPESYGEAAKETATAAAAVAVPVGLALMASLWLAKPVAEAVSQVASGRTEPESIAPEIFFPDPSPRRPDGRLRSRTEFEVAWRVVKKGRREVLARQAQFARGGLRDLACNLVHPLGFALQSVALDFREQRPGLLTVGGITLATATLASGVADAILQSLRSSATFTGMDEHGNALDLHLFAREEQSPGSTMRERLKTLPGSIKTALQAEYRAVTGGVAGAGHVALALTAEPIHKVTSVLVLNGVTTPIDPLDAQFGRSADERRNQSVNAGTTLLTTTIATLCFMLASKWLDGQKSKVTGRRAWAQRMKAFHGDWMRQHAHQVVALHDRLRRGLARGMPRTVADRIVFDELIEPMMTVFRQQLEVHETLYVHAAKVDAARLRLEMLTDHGHPDPAKRDTVYIDRLMKLPREFPDTYAAGRASRVPTMSVVIPLDPPGP